MLRAKLPEMITSLLKCKIFPSQDFNVLSVPFYLAIRPYNDLDTYRQVVNKVVHEGYRLEQPHYCPDVM